MGKPIEERRTRGGVGLSALMAAVVYFALLFWASQGALEGISAYAFGTPAPTQERLMDGLVCLLTIVGLTLFVAGLILEDRLGRQGLGVVSWVLLGLGALLAWTALTGFAGLFMWVATMFGVVVIRFRRRAAYRESLLWTMAIAARNGMPLAPGVSAYGRQVGGLFGARISDLGAKLAEGVPLPVALERVPGALTDEAALFTRVGYEARCLPGALREAASGMAARESVRGPVLRRLAYILALFLAMQSTTGFILYFIAPKFEAIFKDFSVPLPGTTRWVIDAGHALAGNGLISLAVALAELTLLVYVPLAYFGVIQGGFPGLDAFFVGPHRARILRCLAMGVEADRPLAEAFRSLSRWYPKAWARRRLARVHDAVVAGGDWIEALRAEGLLRKSDAALLDAAARAGNLGWALRALAESTERRMAFRVEALAQLLFPLAVLMFGVVVLALSVAYFGPLVSLIEALVEPPTS